MGDQRDVDVETLSQGTPGSPHWPPKSSTTASRKPSSASSAALQPPPARFARQSVLRGAGGALRRRSANRTRRARLRARPPARHPPRSGRRARPGATPAARRRACGCARRRMPARPVRSTRRSHRGRAWSLAPTDTVSNAPGARGTTRSLLRAELDRDGAGISGMEQAREPAHPERSIESDVEQAKATKLWKPRTEDDLAPAARPGEARCLDSGTHRVRSCTWSIDPPRIDQEPGSRRRPRSPASAFRRSNGIDRTREVDARCDRSPFATWTEDTAPNWSRPVGARGPPGGGDLVEARSRLWTCVRSAGRNESGRSASSKRARKNNMMVRYRSAVAVILAARSPLVLCDLAGRRGSGLLFWLSAGGGDLPDRSESVCGEPPRQACRRDSDGQAEPTADAAPGAPKPRRGAKLDLRARPSVGTILR